MRCIKNGQIFSLEHFAGVHVRASNKGLPIPGVRTLADAERAHIISTLRKTNWAVGGRNGAAARLGPVRTTLIAKMRKLGISRETADQYGEALDPCERVLVS
jgi:transcriptional regulator with GAF, ATPase, and Fis domain